MTKSKTIQKFENWLRNKGCTILPTTNDYEAIRWKGIEVGVKYKSGKFNNSYGQSAWIAYKKNLSWAGGPISTKRQNGYLAQKKALLKRDGDFCFYCAKKLGDDITFEHLIELNQGGSNKISNGVLAHYDCNNNAYGLSLSEKIQYAVKQRLKTYGYIEN